MKNTGKKVLSLFLAVCLVLSLAPAAFADGEITTAEALKRALDETGGTITLGADIDVKEALTVSKDTTLDLHGHTLAVNHNGMENYAVLVNAALTIRDSAGGGRITSKTANTLFLDYGEGAKNNSLTLKSGTVENTCRKMGDTAIVAVGTNISTVTITGGTVRSEGGSAMFAQSAVAISGGFFQGEVYLSMPEYNGAEHQTITGGCFDRLPGGWYDFYGKKYEVTDNTDAATKDTYPYAVQEIPANKRVTVSYTFPDGSNLTKPDDYFRKGTEIEMPDAPDYKDHRFIAWSVNGTAISFPYQLGDEAEVTFLAIYAAVDPAPEGFAWEGKPLTDLYVGGKAMIVGGVCAGDLPYTITGDTGTATLAYNDTGSVYTLTLDAYAYTGPGYAWNWNLTNTFNSGIFAKGDLAIVIHSASSIKATDTSADGAVGIAVTEGGLAIASNTSPSPKLTVQGVSSPGSQMSAGVYADGNLAVRNCKLDTNAVNGSSAYGIVAHGSSSGETRNVYVIGADVTAAATASDYGLGIVASGDVTVQNTSLNEVTAKATGAKFSYGAQCENLTIDGGYMYCIANGENAESENCRGVYADGKIAVMSGSLSALAGKAATYHSYGVYAYDDLTVGSLGSVFGISKGTTGYNDSVGVFADDITVGAGAELYGRGGDVTDGDSYGVYTWNITVEADDKGYGELYGVGGKAKAEGDSTGVRANDVTVNAGAELRAIGGKVTGGDSYGVYAWGKLTACGYGAVNDYDYDDEDYDEFTGHGAVDARGGDTAGSGDSCGLYLWEDMAVSDDGAVYAYGGNAASASSDSYGIYSRGDVTIARDSQVEAIGGRRAGTSVGFYAEPDTRVDVHPQIPYPKLQIKNGGQLEAIGGDAEYTSFGVLIDGGMLMMDKEFETKAELRLDATGGDVTNGWSYGVCVIAGEDDKPAISLSGGALVLAAGGMARDEGYGSSIGVCSLGDVKLNNAELHADGEDGSDFTIGLYLYGENRKLTLENNAEVYARAYEATGGSAGVYFDDMEDPGSVYVTGGDCVLSAYAGEAKLSVAIGNIGTLTTGGTISAIAEGKNGSGILMNNKGNRIPAIAVSTGQLGASGKTAAIGAVSSAESPIGDVTLTAPYIEYSIDYSGEPIETVQREGNIATLTANDTQKHIMAFASGTLYSVSVTDITETISYGQPIAFTAKPGPASVVKVEEERWVRNSDGMVISSKNPTAPEAGTYHYELVLVPENEFTFAKADDGVGVIYNDEYFEFKQTEDGKLILKNLDDDVFVPDVTVTAPYVGGTTTYTPTITDSAHGKVTADPKAAAAGDTVKLTATPDAGYELDTLTVKDANGKDVALTKNTDGTYSYVQPAGKVTVTATFKESKAEAVRPFTDVKQGDWFYNAVYHCFDKGYFKGVSETKFDPQGTMTRAMFATVLYRMAGEPTVTGENKFADVKGGQWYTDAILWATQAGIVDGYGDGSFGVDDPITREQMVTMLYRYAQSKGQGFRGLWSFKLDFPDAGDVSDWALEAMSWMVMNGVIKGKDGKLAPGATATRAEVAQLIMNFDGLAG